MSPHSPSVKDLFDRVLEIESLAERQAYLDQACAGAPVLRAKVEALLRAYQDAGGFMEVPAAKLIATIDEEVTERPGTIIGPYKLLEQIGEGGFGVVFMAEQTAPVRRKVALKVIKPGMDTRQVIARFEAERQALALMEHPNIARVLDAGTTEPVASGQWLVASEEKEGSALATSHLPLATAGRPYFVMELVRGTSMTEYCDQHNLPVRERLELFVDVCQAVQHAHQKGIIHRDIKPSNVLVTLHDGKPVVKVIDFGIAKAMGQQLTEKTLFTNFAQMIGTPLYMSPEQAEMSAVDADTRSDIYSLGVLLYELLTGTTPFDKERLKTAGFDEIRRIIREEEPPKPSTRMSSSRDTPCAVAEDGIARAKSDNGTRSVPTTSTIATKRQSDPRKLSRLFRGELDWIVMKALEKDRNRRYETASAFAADVGRYLQDEAVLACPPSVGYRSRKFVQRNRGPVLAASLVLAALVAGVVGTTWGMVRADSALKAEEKRAEGERLAKIDAQAREAETKAVLDFVENKIIAAARPVAVEKGLGHDVTLRKALESALPFVAKNFADQPLIEARLRQTFGRSFAELGDPQLAAEQYEIARALYAKHLGPDHRATLSSMDSLANRYLELKRVDDAIRLHEETLSLRRAKLGPGHPDTLQSMNNLANAYEDNGRYADSLKLREETLALKKASLGPDDPGTIIAMFNLANSYAAHDHCADALKLREETLVLMKKTFGPGHRNTLATMNSLANSYHDVGRYEDALNLRKETLALRKSKLGPEHPETYTSMINLAVGYAAVGQRADALKLLDEALALRAKLGPDRGMELFSIACVHALLVPSAADRAKQGDIAMDWLKKAVAARYTNAAHMRKDKDLDALRDRDDFKALLGELERPK